MEGDEALPGSEVLLGAGAIAVLAPAVAAAGGTLLSARPSQIRYRPGRRLAVRYAAEVDWGERGRRVETLGALVQSTPLPEGLAVVEGDGGARIGVWRYPHDPFLPGLPHAAYPHAAAEVLRHLGVDVGEVEVQPLVYRPATRAVLRITAPGRCVYFKVVRPGEAEPLRALHRALRPHAPVPACLAASEELGLVVLEALDGAPLTRPLVDGGTLPPAGAVLAVSDALRDLDVDAGPSPPRIADHVATLVRALPDAADDVRRLAARAADLGRRPDRTVHGDFYEAQVLTANGHVTGLLDIDGVRRGNAIDDAATLVGHLVALAHVHRRAAPRIHAYRAEVQAAAGDRVGPELLHDTVTGVLLGLATTSFRRQETDWPDRTRAWLDLARRWADEHLDG